MLILQFISAFYCYLAAVYLVECLPIEKYRKFGTKRVFLLYEWLNIFFLFKTVLDSTQSQTELNWDKEAFGDSAEVPGVSSVNKS